MSLQNNMKNKDGSQGGAEVSGGSSSSSSTLKNRKKQNQGKGGRERETGGGGSALGGKWVQCETYKTPSTIYAESLGKKKYMWSGAKKCQRQ